MDVSLVIDQAVDGEHRCVLTFIHNAPGEVAVTPHWLGFTIAIGVSQVSATRMRRTPINSHVKSSPCDGGEIPKDCSQYIVLVRPLLMVWPLPPEPPPVLPPEFPFPPLNNGACPVADRWASIPNNAPRLPPTGMAIRPALTRNLNAIVERATKEGSGRSKVEKSKDDREVLEANLQETQETNETG